MKSNIIIVFFFICFISLFHSCKVSKKNTGNVIVSTLPQNVSGLRVKTFFKDGDRDWSDAIERAINYAQKSGENSIIFENGEYLISRQITVPKDIDFVGKSMKHTIIKAIKGGKFQDAIIRFKGGQTPELKARLGNDISKFDRTLQFNKKPNLKAGDVFIIASKTPNSWAEKFVKGEYLKVQEVIGNKVLIFGQTFDNYKKSDVKIYKYQGTESSISNMTVVGDPRQLKACIKIEKGLNNNFSNLLVKDSDYAGIVTILGYNQSFSNVRAEKSTNDRGKGLSYGINIGNSQNVKLVNCNLYGVRHGLTFGGAGMIKIPNRFNSCINSTLSSRVNYAASFHPNSEFCSYIACDIFGGVVIRGKNHQVSNCNIYNLYDETVNTHMHTISFSANTFDLNHEILDNRIYCKKKTNEGAINFQDRKNKYFNGGSLRFRGNRIEVTQVGKVVKQSPIINFNFNQTDNISQVIFTDNVISSNDPGHLIQFRSFTNQHFHKIVFRDNEIKNAGIFIQSIDQCFIKGNNIEGSKLAGIYIQQIKKSPGSKELISIEGNTIHRCGSLALLYQGDKIKTNRFILRNNTFTENLCQYSKTDKTSTNINVSNVKQFYMQNNIIGNEVQANQKEPGVLNKIDVLHSGNNIWLGKGKLRSNVLKQKKTN